VLNNQALHPTVTLPDVRVVTIVRTPTDLANSGAPSDVTFAGTGSLFLTAAFYHRFAGSVGNMAGTIAQTLVTSVRRRRRDLAILKAVGFVGRQVRASVAWQATAIAGTGLLVGLPLGVAAGRWAWTLLAQGFAIQPVAVLSPGLLLAIPAVLLLANAVAAIPARTAARTRAAVVLRTE
jgi:ABC-type antimicrobial peptide transport system permease subunit